MLSVSWRQAMDARTALPSGRVLLAARIMFNGGRSSIDCIVRNLFDTGAYLEIHAPLGIPERFDLAISGHGEARPCKLEWQTAQRLGVSFVSGKKSEDDESIISTS